MTITLTREQKVELDKKGYSIEPLPELTAQSKITMYRRGELPDEIIEMSNLPSDPMSLRSYLSRGFTIRPEDLTLRVKQHPENKEGFTCETCGKLLQTKLALAGHLRSHQKTNKKEK